MSRRVYLLGVGLALVALALAFTDRALSLPEQKSAGPNAPPGRPRLTAPVPTLSGASLAGLGGGAGARIPDLLSPLVRPLCCGYPETRKTFSVSVPTLPLFPRS
jgi:hypothetical protein